MLKCGTDRGCIAQERGGRQGNEYRGGADKQRSIYSFVHMLLTLSCASMRARTTLDVTVTLALNFTGKAFSMLAEVTSGT